LAGLLANFLKQPFENPSMNIFITAHHFSLTPALEAHVREKLSHVLRHFDQVVEVRVRLGTQTAKDPKAHFTAEANLHIKGKQIFVEHRGEDMYAVIDGLMHRLDRRVSELKDQLKGRPNKT
jgi:putative sigma-54 modulation protein